MKITNRFFLLILVVFMSFLACRPSGPSSKESDVQEQRGKPAADQAPVKKLAEDPENSFASCLAYRVVDQEGEDVELPPAVQSLLECPIMVSISPDNRFLVINDGPKILLYEFEDQQQTPLITVSNDTEGMSDALWSPGGKKLAFVDINQSRYREGTMLYVFFLENGQIAKREQFEVKINRYCGATCRATAGEDFWFRDDQTVVYRTFREVPGDLEGETAMLVIQLDE